MHRRTVLRTALAIPAGMAGIAAANLLADGAVAATPGGNAREAAASGGAVGIESWPDVIDLPNGWQPEGIVIRGSTFYVSSLANGAIYRGSIVTGRGGVFVPGREGGQTVGLEIDGCGRIWAATLDTGGAAVYDSQTGARLAAYSFGGTFVNDAVATRDAVYFTDSSSPNLYVVPLGPGGKLPTQAEVRTIALTGDLGESGAFNNGIETTPNGWLLVVQSYADRLVAFNPRTGESKRVDLGGASVLNGDGMVRIGQFLYVVRNQNNIINKFRLNGSGTVARLEREITNPAFDVPATIAPFGPYLYAANARFTTPPTPDTPYAVVRVRA